MSGMRDWLRLWRAPLAPTAACDALACGILARSPGFAHRVDDGFLAPGPMVLLAATSLLVYAAGMAGNDLADRRRDETLHAERPLPAGRIRPAAALSFVAACAAGALAIGGGPRGSILPVAAALLFAAAYDLGLKRSLWLGSATMGLVRASNASIAVLPLVLARDALPWALLGPLAIGIYSAAITVWSTTEERASRPRRIASRVLALLACAAAGTLSLFGAEGLAVGAFLAYPMATSLLVARVPRPGPAKAQVLEMILGIYLLDASIASAGAGSQVAVSVAALVVAVALVYLSQVWVRALRSDAPTVP